MAIKVVECLDWTAPNQPGELLKYAEHFKKEKVDLEAFWAYTSHQGEPKLAAIGKNPERLKAALGKLGARANASHCFYMTGTDEPGVFVEPARALSGAGINIECADALAAQGKYAAMIWVKEEDLPRAKQILKAG